MNVRNLRRRTGLATAAVGVLLIPAGPAALAAPLALVSPVHSTYFAGYNASITTPVSTVTGTLTVPTVTCPATGFADMSSGVFLNGPGSIFTELFIVCSNGVLGQQPILEVGVNGSSGTGGTGFVFASPGDRLSFAFSGNTATKTLTGVVKNKTTGFSASVKGPGSMDPTAGTPLSVQAGTDSGNGTSPTTVPAFTPGFTIGALKFGASTLSAFSPVESEMFNGTTLQIATGKILAAGSFTTTFKHA